MQRQNERQRRPARRAFTLQLTERCNLRCRYCYVLKRPRRSVRDCSEATCRQFADFVLRECGRRAKIVFFGGEPLLCLRLIRATVRYGRRQAAARNKRLTFHVITNGVLLNDRVGDFLAREGISLEVSVDGPRSAHDRNRRFIAGSGSWETVVTNLRRFHSRHPRHPLSLFAVLTDARPLPWLQRFAREIGARGLSLNPRREFPVTPQTDTVNRRCAQRRVLVESGLLHYRQVVRGERPLDGPTARQLKLFLVGHAKRTCSAGVNSTITTRDGEIYPCPFFVGRPEWAIGNIADGFSPDQSRPFLERASRATMKECLDCPARYSCGRGCAFSALLSRGAIQAAAPADCAATRTVAAELRKTVVGLAARQPEDLLFRTLGRPRMAGREMAASRDRIARWPRSFIVRLSGRCNLACDYCYDAANRAPRMDLARAMARKIADYILDVPVRKPLVGLFGGEPLLNWEVGRFLIETVRREAPARGRNPWFHLTTNGTLITETLARELVRDDLTVQISFDGLQPGHDRHRHYPDGAGSWQSALRGLQRLRAVSPEAKVDAQVVLTPGNCDMTRIARELNTMGFRRTTFLYRSDGDCAGGWTESDIRALMRMREKFYPYFLQSALRGRPEVDLGFAGLVAAQPDSAGGLCVCGSGEIYIDCRGDIYPCPNLYGLDVPAARALGNCATSDARAPLPAVPVARSPDPACARCWAFGRCRGGCMVQCQRCALLPAGRRAPFQDLWCDLLRAQLARAAITHRLLQRYHPEALAGIRSLFDGDAA